MLRYDIVVIPEPTDPFPAGAVLVCMYSRDFGARAVLSLVLF